MITLHQLPPLDRSASLSPFCTKVETYLRMAEIPHEIVYTLDAASGPKGKLPFIIDGAGERLGDSYFILDKLEQTHRLDAHLTAEQRATGLAMSRMLDEHLYWAIVHSRWFDARFAPRMLGIFLGHLPDAQRAAIEPAVLDGMAKTLAAHGIGRHSTDEIVARGSADLSALAALLGARPFLLGTAASTVDATAYAFLSSLLDVEMDTPLKRHAATQPNLVDYAARLRARYYA